MPIPVSQIVTVNPAVVGTGGNPLSLNAVFIDQDPSTPATTLLQFSNQEAVGDYYGFSSNQYKLAGNYFNGPSNSLKKPGSLYFGAYASAAMSAFFRGQSIALTLTQLKAVTGSLTFTIDGTVKTAASVNLSAATSFTNAASLLTTALSLTAPAAVTWNSVGSCFVVKSGTTGVTSTITVGSGTAAAALGLSAGVLSQGIPVDTPASCANRIKNQNYNWATFMLTFDPAVGVNDGFAVWSTGQNKGYLFVPWDDDVGYKVPNNPAVFGSVVQSMDYDGTLVIYGDASTAASVCGYAGSIDWAAVNGRTTLAFRQFQGLAPSVSNLQDAEAVLSNNASYYGEYVDRGYGNNYNVMYDGRMNGSTFKWADSFLCQLYLNAQLRLAIFNGLLVVNSGPYNQVGYTLIRAWCQDPIQEALNNGTIQTGVLLSNSQKATIAQQAGLDISTDLETKGYYLQVLPATAQVRGQRQSPPTKLWYTDGGSIQQITLASIAVL